MSDMLSALLSGDRPLGRARRPGVGIVDGIVEAGQILFGPLMEPPRWHGFDAVAMVVGDRRRAGGVPVLMGLGGGQPDGILATVLDLRAGEAMLVPGRFATVGSGPGDVFVAAEVSSARVEAARDAGRAVGLGDPATARVRETTFRDGASRNLSGAEAAEREMLSFLREDVRQGMSLGEAFSASVAEYRTVHPGEPRAVAMLAARLLRADVGIGAVDPVALAVESSLRIPAPARSAAVGRGDDCWERKPWR